ncbi:MAG: hypothetical protein ACF8QF_13610 [Phycisphaerales bacterium]
MNAEQIVLIVHAASTLMMTGLIWFVQVVHYPLFARVGAEGFPIYAGLHQRLTTTVVGPLMLAEAATAVWLVFSPPADAPPGLTMLGVSLVAVIWLSTALVQVPCHQRLEHGFDASVARRLVRTNWLRTGAWTMRSGVALALLLAGGAAG